MLSAIQVSFSADIESNKKKKKKKKKILAAITDSENNTDFPFYKSIGNRTRTSGALVVGTFFTSTRR
jgi:hypothetical protein